MHLTKLNHFSKSIPVLWQTYKDFWNKKKYLKPKLVRRKCKKEKFDNEKWNKWRALDHTIRTTPTCNLWPIFALINFSPISEKMSKSLKVRKTHIRRNHSNSSTKQKPIWNSLSSSISQKLLLISILMPNYISVKICEWKKSKISWLNRKK